MDLKNLLANLDRISEAGDMKSAEKHTTGPKFVGKWRGTDPASRARDRLVGASESILKELQLAEPVSRLFREYQQYLSEYGGTAGYGAASQAPAGTGNTQDPQQQQLKINQAQIAKSADQLKPTLNSQGAAQSLNPAKFKDVMSKLDAEPNTNLTNQDSQQLGPIAVAASKALKNPQTAGQLKQLIGRADAVDAATQAKVKQQQQKLGAPPAGTGTTPPAAAGTTNTTADAGTGTPPQPPLGQQPR